PRAHCRSLYLESRSPAWRGNMATMGTRHNRALRRTQIRREKIAPRKPRRVPRLAPAFNCKYDKRAVLLLWRLSAMATAPALRFTRPLAAIMLAAFAAMLGGCGINTIPTYEQNAKAAWSEVLNQYKRRSDLIPNLVETVKGFADQERTVLTDVVEARAKATQV